MWGWDGEWGRWGGGGDTLVGGGGGGLEAGGDLVKQVDGEVLLQVQGSAVHPQRGQVLLALAVQLYTKQFEAEAAIAMTCPDSESLLHTLELHGGVELFGSAQVTEAHSLHTIYQLFSNALRVCLP